MKAREVLQRYQQGERDFRRVNLRGQSFKGQDLSGADFSECDIRGASFAGANLTDVNFSNAKAGLRSCWAALLIAVSLLLSVLSGAASGLTGIIASQVLFPTPKSSFISSVIVFLVLGVFFIFTFRQGFNASLVVMVGTIAGSLILFGLVFFALFGFKGLFAVRDAAWEAAGAGLWAVTGLLGKALVVFDFVFEVMASVSAVLKIVLLVSAIAVVCLMFPSVFQVTAFAWPVTVTTALIVTLLGSYVGRQALIGDGKFILIRRIVIAFAAIGGTSFRGANLTNADFTQATLKSTDMRDAILTRACWRDAVKLDLARVGETILADAAVRELLVSSYGYKKSYINANLRGANLAGANLNEANLKLANLSEATLVAAHLDGANLVEVNAVGTDFTHASMTGACIEAWNIDSSTKLDQVDCQYIYTLEHPKPRTDDRERCPSSGIFQPGDFTKLFEEVLNTVDLIFRNGVNWKAFVDAFEKVQVENEDTPLQIQSIQNKGDGVIVVKVKVPPETNKGKIHQDFTHNYELALQAVEEKYKAVLAAKEEQIEDKDKLIQHYLQRDREQSVDMMEITKILANNQQSRINVEAKAMAGDTYQQSGNIGVGHISRSKIDKEEIKVANIINEAQQQDLAQAAAEIQKLLKQLEESYPTSTATEQMLVATKAIEQIESSPDWKQRAVNAFKQGSLKALEAHPVGAFVVGAIKGWQ